MGDNRHLLGLSEALPKAPSQVSEANSMIGKTIDGYKILAEIGVGGFSIVYKVEPLSLPGQVFALKLVKNSAHRFLLEAEAAILAKLRHSKIPCPVKLGTCEEGSYLVMQYIPETLQRYLDIHGNKPGEACLSTWEEAVNLTLEILNIVEHTHSKKIIHKDLKPSNIGLFSELEGGVVVKRPVLLDFNISNHPGIKADTVNNSHVNSEVLRVDGFERSLIGGTHGYASPEQQKIKVEGIQFAVSEATDIYSVGVILYQMLTGYLPQGNFKKASDVLESRHQDCPKWIDEVISTALAPRPTERFQSAARMFSHIKECLQLKEEEPTEPYIRAGIRTVLGFMSKATIPLVLLAVLGSAIYGISALVSMKDESDKKFEETLRGCNPQGTIIYRNNDQLCCFIASNLFTGKLPIMEIKCPSSITDIAYLGTMSVAWIGEYHYNDYTQSRGAVYVTNLQTKTTERILVATLLMEELYESFGKQYAKDLTAIASCKGKLYVKAGSGRWYYLEPRKDSTYVPTHSNGYIQSDIVTQVSPNGLLKIKSTSERSLYIEHINTQSSRYLSLSGSDPIWISEEIK